MKYLPYILGAVILYFIYKEFTKDKTTTDTNTQTHTNTNAETNTETVTAIGEGNVRQQRRITITNRGIGGGSKIQQKKEDELRKNLDANVKRTFGL